LHVVGGEVVGSVLGCNPLGRGGTQLLVEEHVVVQSSLRRLDYKRERVDAHDRYQLEFPFDTGFARMAEKCLRGTLDVQSRYDRMFDSDEESLN
jgi:hypothetical protein